MSSRTKDRIAVELCILSLELFTLIPILLHR